MAYEAVEQHFLTNPTKLEALVQAAEIQPGTLVLELGAGGGTVTAALPPCRLTLVERDERLAARLRRRFRSATVLQEDARGALERLKFDVLLSNLPHTLTADIMARLQGKTFERALVTVHEGNDLAALGALSGGSVSQLLTLDETDFTPPQPFKSKLIRVTPRLVT